MDLHLHLTVAFRALDHKWGKPIDLDTSEDYFPCLPAVVEIPTATFSSEDYLKTIRRNRPKPYSRTEDKRRGKRNVKGNDSFSNISLSRMPLHKDSENTESHMILDHDKSSIETISERTLESRGQVNYKKEQKLQNKKCVSSTDISCSERKEDFNKILKFNTISNLVKKLKRKAKQ